MQLAIALRSSDGFRNVNLITNYLDGVSINSNHEHVWSFVASCACSDFSFSKPGSQIKDLNMVEMEELEIS